jgi:hypothetical protein
MEWTVGGQVTCSSLFLKFLNLYFKVLKKSKKILYVANDVDYKPYELLYILGYTKNDEI